MPVEIAKMLWLIKYEPKLFMHHRTNVDNLCTVHTFWFSKQQHNPHSNTLSPQMNWCCNKIISFYKLNFYFHFFVSGQVCDSICTHSARLVSLYDFCYYSKSFCIQFDFREFFWIVINSVVVQFPSTTWMWMWMMLGCNFLLSIN